MAVNFTRTVQTTDSATGRVTSSPTTIPGSAIQTRGNPKRYEALQLRETEAPTLLWTPAVYGQQPDPAPGDLVEWRSRTWTVKDVDAVAPDGVLIVARIIIVR